MDDNGEILHQWKQIAGVSLNIMKCGTWASNSSEKALFVIIPGNPGCMGFYNAFAEALFMKTKIPVWGIAHTGHVSVSRKNAFEEKSNIEHPSIDDCGLWPQIHHKIAFLEEEVIPTVDKVYLVGHSIGCYIILHILNRMNNPKLHKAIMLFPTIERMALTPKGKLMTPALVYGRWAFIMLAWLLSCIPSFLKTWLIGHFFKSTDQATRNTVLHDILCPKVTASCTYMAMEEMLMVGSRDDYIIQKQSEKLVFYYGAIDHWCPVSFYNDMKNAFQDVNIQLCKNGYKHAFVLRESEEVAEIVYKMWKNNFLPNVDS